MKRLGSKPATRPDGRYSCRAVEVESIMHNYEHDPEAITAVESPQAIDADPRGKRSGVYVREPSEAEVVAALRARCSGGG